MVDEKHCDDETLLTLLGEDHVSNEHLSACSECRDRYESFRLIAGALEDEATWDERPLSEAPVPETIANLRSFADRMAIEDAQATLYLEDLLDGPREQWMENLRQHPEYRTAGVVRRLIEAASSAIDTMPRDAVQISILATEIADHLDPSEHTTDTVPKLRGAAWRERAYALFYTGDFSDAERALCASERHFTESVVSEYDLARVGIVRALVERGLEDYSSAIEHARQSARQFRRYDDAKRSAAARLAEVNLHLSCHEYSRAFEVLLALKSDLQDGGDTHAYAAVLANLGKCCFKLHRVDEALRYLDAASLLFADIGVRSESTRVAWSAAQILASEGRLNDALPRLKSVTTELEHLGMMAAATQASLEVAELLVTEGAFEEVQEICRTAIRQLQESRVAYTAPALTAIALMQESARNRTATRKLVSHVREYLRRIPDEPHLLFALPPE